MKRFGLSIYPNHDNLDECLTLIEQAGKAGLHRIFSCLISMDPKDIHLFQQLIPEIHKHNLILIPDVSSSVFEKLHLDQSKDPLAFFAEMGLDGIRLDYGFDEEKIADFTRNPHGLIIEINASMPFDFEKLFLYQPDLSKLQACHNFYPQAYTGLSDQNLSKYNKPLKESGLSVVSFISSKHPEACGPWPVKEGLSTQEKHRHLSFVEQLADVLSNDEIDEVLISNMPVLEQELEVLKELNQDCLSFTLELEDELPEAIREMIAPYFNKPIWLRPERSEYLLRSAGRIEEPVPAWNSFADSIKEEKGLEKKEEKEADQEKAKIEKTARIEPEVKDENRKEIKKITETKEAKEEKTKIDLQQAPAQQSNKETPVSASSSKETASSLSSCELPSSLKSEEYQPGEVLLLNQNYGRYNGELQIVLKPMPIDSRKNRIGKIAKKDLEKLLLSDFVNYVLLKI